MEKKDMVSVGTKVSPEARAKFTAICKKLGFSEYDALQMFIDVFIRMVDEDSVTSYEMERLIQLMDGIKDWRYTFRLTDGDKFINEAFYVLSGEHTKKVYREGKRIAYVKGKAGYKNRTVTYNIQTILEAFCEIVLPKHTYLKLRALGNELQTSSIYDTLMRLVDEQRIDPQKDDKEEIRITFSEDDWHEGFRMSEQQRTKHTRNNHPELFQ